MSSLTPVTDRPGAQARLVATRLLPSFPISCRRSKWDEHVEQRCGVQSRSPFASYGLAHGSDCTMRSYRLPLDLGCEGDPQFLRDVTVGSVCGRRPLPPQTTATATQLASVNDWAAPRESARPCTLSIGSAGLDETGTLNSSTPDSQPSGPGKRLQEASASGSQNNHVVFGLWSADSS